MTIITLFFIKVTFKKNREPKKIRGHEICIDEKSVLQVQ